MHTSQLRWAAAAGCCAQPSRATRTPGSVRPRSGLAAQWTGQRAARGRAARTRSVVRAELGITSVLASCATWSAAVVLCWRVGSLSGAVEVLNERVGRMEQRLVQGTADSERRLVQGTADSEKRLVGAIAALASDVKALAARTDSRLMRWKSPPQAWSPGKPASWRCLQPRCEGRVHPFCCCACLCMAMAHTLMSTACATCRAIREPLPLPTAPRFCVRPVCACRVPPAFPASTPPPPPPAAARLPPTLTTAE